MKKPIVMIGAALCLTLLSFSQALAAEASKNSAYPLTTCVVTGEKLGSMGAPYVHKHEGREIQFCCKSCLKKFSKEPAKYMAKLDAASRTAKPAARAPKAAGHGCCPSNH